MTTLPGNYVSSGQKPHFIILELKLHFYGMFVLIFALCYNQTVISPTSLIKEQPVASKLKTEVAGTNYYIAKNGSDSNTGAIGSPFLTIQKAANIVSAGDSVIVNDGVYVSHLADAALVRISRGGTSMNPVVFKSKNKYGAVLDGESQGGYGFDLSNNASYVKIQDFKIKNFRNDGIGCNAQVLTGGVYVTKPSNYITIEGNKIHDIGRYSTTTDNGISGIYLRKGNHHWTITRNLIYNIGRTGPGDYWLNKDHAIYIGATDTRENAAHHNVISYNIMWGCSGVAITNGGNYDSILNNVFAWSNENSRGGSPFIAPDSNVSDLLIANNIFYQPPTSNPYALANLGAIIRWTVKNNMVYGGRMWETYGSAQSATMGGGNYGQTDCENAEVNPLFVSAIKTFPLSADYHLKSTSMAINRGVNFGLTLDFAGNPIVGLPDMGAYEYTTGSTSHTYYVATNGNNAYPGTSALPFLTIQHAADIVNPGDTVIVKDGNYTNTTEVFISISRSGTPDNYIVFKSQNKWGAILDGLEVNLTNGGAYAFDINSGASYIKIQDFEIKNFIHAAVISNDQILTSSYIVIEGNKIHDNGRFENTVEEKGAVGVYARQKSHHWTINANLIYNIGRTGPDNLWLNKDHAIYTGQTASTADAAHHFTITNNIMFGCSGVAVVLCGTNDLVANNVMAWSTENSQGGSPLMAFQIYVTDLIIANNIFFEPPATSHNYALANIGNVVRWTVKNNMVYGGRMWKKNSDANKASMAGGNFGKSDCENGEVDPKFVNAIKANAPNVDFRLLAGSPAINAGINVGLTSDFLKNKIVGLPDIGAYEYAVSNPTPTAIPTVCHNNEKSANKSL